MKKIAIIPVLIFYALTAAAQLSENNILTEWRLTNPFGIKSGTETEMFWTSGRVNDILEIDDSTILTASDGSGVWKVRRGGGSAVGYSKQWNTPDMQTLSKYNIPGTNRTLYFAGGSTSMGTPGSGLPGSRGALYQTKHASAAPLLEEWEPVPLGTIPLGSIIGPINKILVLQELNKIVLATANGIWSSNIPASGLPRDYVFRPAIFPANYTHAFYDLTESSGSGVVASVFGSETPGSTRGIFWGSFSGNVLNFLPSRINGLVPGEEILIGTTSVSSCNAAKNVVYAIAARDTGSALPLAFLRSTNGGQSFNRLPIVITNNISPQFGISGMFRTNCIDVHPLNPAVVAFGWVHGPFISSNSGASFVEVESFLSHDDKASLVFSKINMNRLYLGCDGGAVSFNNFRNSDNYGVDLTWNMRLPTLQFVGPTGRGWWGKLGVKNDQIGGGLQDNGVVHSENGQRWKYIQIGSDGSTVLYPACGGILWSNGSYNVVYRNVSGTDLAIPITVFAPGALRTNNTLFGVMCLVNGTERRRNARGQSMYAVAGNRFDTINGMGELNNIYGIFANTDGTGMHAEFLVTVTAAQSLTSAISSNGSDEILVGKASSCLVHQVWWDRNGRLGQATGSGMPARNDFRAVAGGVIDIPGSFEGFAFRMDENGVGTVYYTPDGVVWNNISSGLPPEAFYSMDLFRNSCKEILFVTTDKAVYATTNKGASWTNVSFGLPFVAHCSDIHVVPSDNCTTDIYLSTYGWSVWKAGIK